MLEVVGETDEPAIVERPLYDADRYGDQWAPVLIAWTDETVIPELAGTSAGIGGSGWFAYESEPGWYVSGIVYIDSELGPDLSVHRSVLLHELGHVLGLDHVNDASQIMNAESTVGEFGKGGLAGSPSLVPAHAQACCSTRLRHQQC